MRINYEYFLIFYDWMTDLLTLVLLNPDIPCVLNGVGPDQLAWSGSALFAIKYVNL